MSKQSHNVPEWYMKRSEWRSHVGYSSDSLSRRAMRLRRLMMERKELNHSLQVFQGDDSMYIMRAINHRLEVVNDEISDLTFNSTELAFYYEELVSKGL